MSANTSNIGDDDDDAGENKDEEEGRDGESVYYDSY